MNSLNMLALLCLSLASQAQTLSERPVTTISPAPPVVVPAKRVTVSQALRFGEQAEPRPETLAKRSDLPVMAAGQPVMFDYDLLRWELGFDRGDGYHKLRIRVTNLADTPQGFEFLYAPTASRDGSAETNWRIVASQMIQPGQVFTDWQSVLIENNITRLVFLMRRRDVPAKDRAVSAYSRNPEADYPIPAAVSIKADLTGDLPKIVAVPSPSAPTQNMPLILPAMPVIAKLPTSQMGENPDNHFRQHPFKLERAVDLPVLAETISFELEGLRWEIQHLKQCLASMSQRGGTKMPMTRCSLKLFVTVTNLTNDKQSAILMSSIPEQGDGTVGDSWSEVATFQDIYPGRSASEEKSLSEIHLTEATQRTIPLRWLFRAYRQPGSEELMQRQMKFNEALQSNNSSTDQVIQAYRMITDPPAAYWKVLIANSSNQKEGQLPNIKPANVEVFSDRMTGRKISHVWNAQSYGKLVNFGQVAVNVSAVSSNVSSSDDSRCASCPGWIVQMTVVNNSEHRIDFPLSGIFVLKDGQEIGCEVLFHGERKQRTTYYVPILGGVSGSKTVKMWEKPFIDAGQILTGTFAIRPQHRLTENELKTGSLLVHLWWQERASQQETWFKLSTTR